MQRKNISSGSKWEDIIGYSRAVRIGNLVEVTGTVASDADGNVIGKDDPYQQTKAAILKIEKALKDAGATLNDVVRTRMFVTDIAQWEAYGKAHGEFFGTIKPCTTMVEVTKLIGDEFMVEVEASAVVNH